MFHSLFNLLKTTNHSLTTNITNIWGLLSSYTFLFKLRNVISVYITVYDYLQPKYYNILSKKKNFINIYMFLIKMLLIILLVLN